ncbi:TonB-dependent receptor, partial [Rhizobiaceae sp. 2RAB30]
MIRTIVPCVSMLALATAIQPQAGHAQEQDATVLEAIVVTATKRVQEAFEVAGTVATAGADELRERSIVSTGQLDQVFVDTSIKPRSSRAYTNVTIRGQSSVDFYNPSVQLYVDGLPQDPATFSQLLPAGLESVELLYGPQGTLYGRGAIGGVVNIVTRKPDNDFRVEGTGTLQTTGGDGNLLLNVPIVVGVLFGDAALTFRREADEYTVLGTGADIGGTTDWNGRLRMRYAPEDSPLDIMVTAQRGKIDSTEEQFVMEAMFEDRIALPVPSSYELDTTSFGINASYDLGFATIVALTGYQDRDLDRTIFGSYTPETQKTFNQELRIASNPDQGNALDYVVGLYGQRLDFERRIPSAGMASQQTIDSYAAFADLTWHATDSFDVSPGLRFDYERAEAQALGGVHLNDDASFTAVSPKLGVSYAVSDDWRVYALYSTGFKAGGFTRNVTPANIA